MKLLLQLEPVSRAYSTFRNRIAGSGRHAVSRTVTRLVRVGSCRHARHLWQSGLREGKKFTASLGVDGLFDLLAEKGYNGRLKSGFIALDLAYWRMR